MKNKLENLLKFKHSNFDFFVRLVSKLKIETNLNMDKIHVSILTNDLDRLKMLFHKIKPNFHLLGIDQCAREELDYLENIKGFSEKDVINLNFKSLESKIQTTFSKIDNEL